MPILYTSIYAFQYEMHIELMIDIGNVYHYGFHYICTHNNWYVIRYEFIIYHIGIRYELYIDINELYYLFSYENFIYIKK